MFSPYEHTIIRFTKKYHRPQFPAFLSVTVDEVSGLPCKANAAIFALGPIPSHFLEDTVCTESFPLATLCISSMLQKKIKTKPKTPLKRVPFNYHPISPPPSTGKLLKKITCTHPLPLLFCPFLKAGPTGFHHRCSLK